MRGDFLDLQRHEALIKGRHVIIGRGAAKDLFVALGNLRLIAQGANVVPLAHTHGAACFLDGNVYIELAKRFDKNLRRGE